MLFVGSCSGVFRAFDRLSGEVLWEYDIHQDGKQRSFHGDPLLVGNLVLATADNAWTEEGVGHVYAFEQGTGAVRWKHREEIGIASDVVLGGSTVYAITLRDELLALDLHTGDERWRFKSGAKNAGFEMNASPAVAGERIYMGAVDGTVYALDAASGDTVWKRSLEDRVTTNLLIHRGQLYVGTAAGRMFLLNGKTGAVDGEIELPGEPRDTPAVVRDGVLVFAGRNRVVCLDPLLKKVRWQQKTVGRWRSKGFAVRGELVLAGNNTGEVIALDSADGTPRWRRTLTGDIRSVGGSGELMYAGTFEGMLYVWRAED